MRSAERGVTAVDAAMVVAAIAGMLAATAPACIRAIRLTRTAEASQNLDRLINAAALHASRPGSGLTSTPLTPAAVPRGTPAEDPAGTWDHPTFKALGFSIEEPHWYSYRVDVDVDPATPLRVVAQGDLDGDGVLSTFERTARREGGLLVAKPGLVVSSDLE